MDQDNLPKCKTFVVKIASRCNINCTYCYMYNMGDESYKIQPKIMSEKTLIKMLERVKDHCKENNLKKFTFVLHGGEPLLAGMDFIQKFIEYANEILGKEQIKSVFTLQTNGLLLTKEWCVFLKENGVSVGISLDGLKKDNDANRIDHKGEGTYDRILDAIALAQDNSLNPGLLSVINVNSNPKDIYNLFKSLDITSADFLLLESTYETLPPKPSEGKYVNSSTPYGDWLIDMFDIWFHDEDNFYIRRFQQYIHSVMGGDISGDEMGNLHNEVLVIETNGDYEAVDALKVCGNNFTKTNANVGQVSISEAMQTELAYQYYNSHFNLPKKCIVCPINETCGGGYIPHRYSKQNGFNNPSVYCDDLLKLITHIQNTVYDSLPKDLVASAELQKLTLKEAKEIIAKEQVRMIDLKYLDDLEKFRMTS